MNSKTDNKFVKARNNYYLKSGAPTARVRLYNFDEPELDDEPTVTLLAGWFLLGREAGGCGAGVTRVAVGVGLRSATFTTCIAPNAAVFFDRFAPGTPDNSVAQLLLVLYEIIVFRRGSSKLF